VGEEERRKLPTIRGVGGRSGHRWFGEGGCARAATVGVVMGHPAKSVTVGKKQGRLMRT
jgi:hypothetical protein